MFRGIYSVCRKVYGHRVDRHIVISYRPSTGGRFDVMCETENFNKTEIHINNICK